MLLRFRVSNHLSISEAQEISFVTSSLKDDSTALLECPASPTGTVLPALLVYGANASGKSNLIDALGTMKSMVLRSHAQGEPGGGIPRKSFKLNPSFSEFPSQFDIDFVVEDLRYHYGFQITDEVVAAEWLYSFPGSHRRTLFRREFDDFHFGRWLKGKNSNIANLTRSNSLYLSAAAQNDHELLAAVFQYFNSIQLIRDIAIPSSRASAQLTENGLDARIIEFLKKINTGVTGYQKKETEVSGEALIFAREFAAFVEKILKFL